MSLSYERLDAVEVRDPRTILDNKREYAVLRAGQQTTWKYWTTTSISNSSINWSAPPPSGNVIVDRKIYCQVPIRLTFVGDAGSGNLLLNPNQDAPRAYPLSSGIDTLRITINGYAVSINMADIIHGLLHFNTDAKLKELDYSMTPSCPDQSQAYTDLFGDIRNPLGFYGDSNDESVMGRGGFPFTIVANSQTAATVDMVVCEPFFLSPLYFGHGNDSGFYNVNAFDVNITFLAQAGNRMWSHDATSIGVASSITSVSAQFSNFTGSAFSYAEDQPYLLINYITPNETQILSPFEPITYPYFDIQRYPTDDSGSRSAYTDFTIASNNIQLNSVPRRVYVWLRERNQDLYSTPNNPDAYAKIRRISVQFMNQNGLLASATPRQLYEMSVKNHCNLSWSQWSGDALIKTGNAFSAGTGNPATYTNAYAGIGSLVCIEFASDIGLDSLTAPGKLGQYMLQINVDATNIANRSVWYSLYLVVVSEGTFTVEGLGKASSNIGVISSQDILDSKQNAFINYADVEDVNGGNFLSGLKKFGKNLWKFGRETRILSKGLKAIPHPYAQTAAPIVEAIGLGGEGCYDGMCDNMGSGVMVGGRRKKGGLVPYEHRGQGLVPYERRADFPDSGSGVLVGGKRLSRMELKKKLGL